ncbi:MAG: ATP-dependent helicase, partial [Patescibacteria group bacterium]|nr:ATP-dependent helicase [Patescibacteria group bacterium]
LLNLFLDAADSLIANNITANLLLPKKINLHSQQKQAEPIKLAVLNDYFAEYQFIAEDIQKKIKQGVPPENIAIIGRNNKDLNLAAETLERCGIPFVIHSDQNILQDLYIQKLIFTLRAIWNIGSERDLLKAMHLDLFDIEPLDIYKIMDFSRQNKLPVYEVLRRLMQKSEEKLRLSSFENLVKFYQTLTAWQKDAYNDTFEKLFIGVVEKSGFREAMLKHSRRYELLDKLTALFEEIKVLVEKEPNFNLGDYLNYLELCQKHELPLKSHVETVSQNAVRLMTAHRSKGLEFDYVYIVNVYDGHWGNARKRSAGFQIPWDILGIKLNLESTEDEDERRLFYVGMTRARKDIMLTFSTRGMEGNERSPSQFLSEIDKRLVEEINTQKFEKQFLANKDMIFNPRPASILPAKNEQALLSEKKEFFRQLFLIRGLSATALSNYQKCPWQFFYRNLLQFPEVKENYMKFGTAIHHALDCYIRQRKNKALTGYFLVERFREVLDKEALSEPDRKALFERGERALLGYFDNVIPTWGKDIQSELIIRGVKLSDEVVLTGRLDMIEMLSGSDVAVYDFKTGKAKSRSQIDGSNEKSERNYLQQLVFYKILLDRYKNGLMKMTEGVIDFVEPDEKGRFKSERFDMTEELVKNLEQKILQTAKEIINLEFWDRRCDDPKCEYCQLKNLTM